MKEPTPRNSRLALAGGLAAILVVGGGGFVLGRRSGDAPAPPSPPVAAAEPARQEPARPVLVAPFDRAGLLAIASVAADAVTLAGDRAVDVEHVVGRRFSIALPFGCTGPLRDDDAAGTGWRYDAAGKALRVQVAPNRWPPADWWSQAAPAGVQAIDGFWIARPWSSSEACPALPSPTAAIDADPVTLPGQTLAIGQVVGSDATRQDGRDTLPYVAVVRTEPDAVRTDQGFRLRLSGRLAALPGGQVTHCHQPGGAEQRPLCLIGVTFEEVAIENPATGTTLARWSGNDSIRTE
ncbi:hypothetical protein [Sphingomonas hankookensis]|uniref:Uncharacterized protein n=1 Tax=Sphingomonas hengshuiensis TaxID=1609977 RepID=A0A2W4ZA08_9SPHN|nr:MAG: hypothetical protein DI632_06305 [Sphingomonas hengshuiensis]